MADKITITDALSQDMWKFVWAGEPNRKIEVEMTYDDLMKICDVLQGKEHDITL